VILRRRQLSAAPSDYADGSTGSAAAASANVTAGRITQPSA